MKLRVDAAGAWASSAHEKQGWVPSIHIGDPRTNDLMIEFAGLGAKEARAIAGHLLRHARKVEKREERERKYQRALRVITANHGDDEV